MRWAQRLQAAWLQPGPLACTLLPLAWLYGSLVCLRRWAYAGGLLASYRAPVPVLVVGNVVAGGAGKTPTLIALVEHLQARGLQVGVVTRGYGRRKASPAQDCLEVVPSSLPQNVGDEPLLIQRRTGVPVFVARRRPQAVRALLAAYPQTQLVLCDDGLQHLALARDVEVVVFDARGTGNGWLLPAGPLREPWPRKTAIEQPKPTALVLHSDPGTKARQGDLNAFYAPRSLAGFAVNRQGQRVALASLHDQPLHALAGIAQPEAFFSMLRAQGLQLAHSEALPDHYNFNSWKRTSGMHCSLICTEKDAPKLWPHAPDALAVPLQLQPEAAFFAAVEAALAIALPALSALSLARQSGTATQLGQSALPSSAT